LFDVHFSYLSLGLFPDRWVSYLVRSRIRIYADVVTHFVNVRLWSFPHPLFTKRHPPCLDPKFILLTASERRKPAATAKHPRRNVLVPFRVCIASNVGIPNLVFGSSGSHLRLGQFHRLFPSWHSTTRLQPYPTNSERGYFS
jgi:hypothetical protein